MESKRDWGLGIGDWERERGKTLFDIMSGKSLTMKNSPRPRVSPSPRHSYRNYLGGHDMIHFPLPLYPFPSP